MKNLGQKIKKGILISFALFLFMTGGYVVAAATDDDVEIMNTKSDRPGFRVMISTAEGTNIIKKIEKWKPDKVSYTVGTGKGTVFANGNITMEILSKTDKTAESGEKKITFDLECLAGMGETIPCEVETDSSFIQNNSYIFNYEIKPPDGITLFEAKYRIANLSFVEQNEEGSTVQTEESVSRKWNDQVVYVFDNCPPQINYKYESETTKPIITAENSDEEKCFYAEPFQGEVRISDLNLDANAVFLHNIPGYAQATIMSLTSEENHASAEDAEVEEGTEVVYQYKFSEEGSYRLMAEAKDILENTDSDNDDGIVRKYSKVMVLDTIAPEVAISISKENGTKITSLEGKCFKEDLTISVQASDDYLDRESLCLTIKGWTTEGESVTYTVEGDAWIQNEKGYSCEYKLSEDGAYCFEISARDFAGNSGETLPLENKTFYIDRTAPVVKIDYDDTEAKNEFYYQDERTATITVNDFTFEKDKVEFLIAAQEGNSPVYGEWTHHEGVNCDGERHTESCRYTREVTFDKDDIYDVEVQCRDRAGNSSDKAGGHFVIDRTAPVILITYDQNRDDGGYFYNAARTASVVVTDLSFDRDAVVLKTAQSNYSSIPQTDSWNNAGEKHTLPVVFDRDGNYQFTVSATDLAGNQAEVLSSEYFVIDKTPPVLSINGVENLSAYNGEVRPEIIYGDLYLDDSKTAISCTGVRGGQTALSVEKMPVANGFSILYQNFSYTKETDDLYILTASAQDKAGNISEESVMFSVNRFGSVYVPSEETRQMLDNYYIDGREDLIINEINVDYLTATEITSSHNGEIKTLEAGRDYLVTEEGTEGAWKTYRYVISDSNFAQDGYYVLTLSSTDKAQNSSDNRIKGTELNFAVDRTGPSMVVSGVRNHAVYCQDAVKVMADVQDNMSIDSLSVCVDEQLLCEFDRDTLQKSGGVVSFSIEEADKSRKLTLCAKDTAGNIKEKTYSDITVSTNGGGRLLVKMSVITGVLVLAIVIVGGLFSRRKKLLSGIAMFVLLFFPISVQAGELPGGENPLIYEARNGVLQINLTYVDEEGKNEIVQGGSGFLIGDEASAEYLITNYDFLNVTEELRRRVAEESGVEDSERLQFQIQVVVKRDITVDAELITCSEEMNIAVLKLSKSIYDRSAMVLDVDADAVSETANVYTLGFPEDIQQMQDISYYTQEDVSVMNGMVSKKPTVNGILYIQHSAVVSGGNSGGPLLDEAGHVIGMNQVLLNDGYYYSVHISEITAILDALGVPYTEYIPEEAVDVSLLEAAVKDVEIKDMDHYTAESIEHLFLIVEESKALLGKEDLTQEEVDQALLQLKSAEAELEVKSGFDSYLLIGGGVVLLLLIAVILLLVLLIKSRKTGKRQAEKEQTETEPTAMERQPNMAAQPVVAASVAGRARDNGGLRGQYSFLQQGVMGETTVLGADSGNNLIVATLIRIKNNEKILIQKMTFYLGKDAQKADYCIKDNPSVSRSHAVIKQINGGFYLEDLQATNGTFHNGVRLQPSQSVRLSNGDQIRLADEEFRILL